MIKYHLGKCFTCPLCCSERRERERERERELEDEEDVYERKRLERKLREKEAAYQEVSLIQSRRKILWF